MGKIENKWCQAPFADRERLIESGINGKRMIKQTTQEQSDKILQELLSLEHITDPSELRSAIRTTLVTMSDVEKDALDKRLGKRTAQIERRSKLLLVLKIMISLLISRICFYLILHVQLSLFWKIIVIPTGSVSGIMVWVYLYYLIKPQK